MEIFTRKSEIILFDEIDFEKIDGFSWYLSNGYARTSYLNAEGKRTSLYMHRLILKPEKGFVVDHVNHIQTDNRRPNLRVCTVSQNAMNNQHAKGVHWDSTKEKWVVRININRKQIFGGRFNSYEEALAARKELVKIHFKDFAFKAT